MKLATRMSRLGTEMAFEVLHKARQMEAQGMDVVHLEIGGPDFSTPRHIVDAAVDALNDGHTHYGPSSGIPELRRAIADDLSKSRGIHVDPDQVVVTPGAKPIMFFTMLALAEPGDDVIYPNPGFPIYESMIGFVGARPVAIPLREEREFRIDVEELISKITPATRLIILNSPHNPTGSVLTREELGEIARVAVERDIAVLSDEVYCRILHEGEHVSIAGFPGMAERTIILDGFSKTYAMTGWRLGYAAMPHHLAEHVTRLVINSVSCTSTFSQRAAVAAITGSQAESDKMVREFRARRDLMVAGLNEIPGIRCQEPKGAFYVFPNIGELGLDSDTFADRLLREVGVAALPGTAFGSYGEGYLRISYANSRENLRRGLERIATLASRVREDELALAL